MTVSALCDTFRGLAFRTWDQLARARRVGHQPLEETFTDLNLLELKDRHPTEVITQVFTKPQEGINGADWEWWLTDPSKSIWLGLRIQAKVLELSTSEFKHLHYRNGRAYQASKLQSTCRQLGLIPLYCLYLQAEENRPFATSCRSFAHARESFGCSLVPIWAITRLRRAGRVNHLDNIASECNPWHCLVCCQGYGGTTLPERSWRFLQNALDIQATRGAPDTDIDLQVGPRRNPPPYVYSLLERPLKEVPDKALRGIVIVKESPVDDRR